MLDLTSSCFISGDLPIIISCASLALADAGIMMYDLVTSVSVSCFGKNIVIDPTSDEEAWQDGSLMVAFMLARKEITQLTLTGEWSDGKITNVYATYCTNIGSISVAIGNILLCSSTGGRALHGCLQ